MAHGNPAKSIAGTTYERLKMMIMAGDLPPGHVLEERPLARQLDVSRTPLRSAMDRLLGAGLLERLSNGLLVVGQVGLDSYLEILRLRKMLESEAAARAAGNVPLERLAELRKAIDEFTKSGSRDNAAHLVIDDQLHGLVAESADSPILCDIIMSLRDRARLCSVARVPGRIHFICAEHLAIIDRLEAGDTEGARDAMAMHIEQVSQTCLKAVSRNSGVAFDAA